MATGLGAFAEGFAQGYGQISEIEARRQGIERDKQRMALEEKRAGMDEQRFALDKQLQEQAMQKTGMDIAAAKREEAFQADVTSTIANLKKEAQAGYEAEVIDARTNKSQGFKRFQNPEDEIGSMKEKGLFFKPGSTKQVGPMDPIEFQNRFADQYMSVQARHGKLTPEILEQAKARRKQNESEGAVKAARYFLTTGDEKGARDIFNKEGKITIGDDVQLQVVNDPIIGPKIVGLRSGKKIFDMFEDVILPSMSADAYAKAVIDMRKLGITEGGEDRRAGMAARAAMDRTVYESNARLAAANKDKGDEAGKDLYKYTLEFAGKFASNPSFTWEPSSYMRWASTVAAKAEQYRQKGMSIPEAAAKATTEIPVPDAVTAKPKK